MLKCNELYHLAPDNGEARPFWQGRARDAQADIQCAMGCGAQLPETPQSAEPPPAPAAATITPTCMNDELVAAQEICARAKTAVVEMFSHVRMGRALELENISVLVDDISASIARHPNAFISLARLKSLDDYTYMHSVAVCALMIALGNQLNLPAVLIRRVGMAGLLHDIGKACLPLDILQKPGKLTDAEFDTVRRHPERGHALLLQGELTSAAVLDVCLHHHEKVDGSGYPHGLAGTDISLFARMGAVCDVYDAITSNRPYKTGWDPAESVARMLSWHGHFDEQVLTAFIKTVGIYPVGSLVALRSGRVAVVIEQNPEAFTKPVVKVFFSNKAGVHIAVERIDLARPGEQDIIVGREARERWDSRLIDGLWAGEWVDGAV